MDERDLNNKVHALRQKENRTPEDDRQLDALYQEQYRLMKADEMEWDAFIDAGSDDRDPLDFDDGEPEEDDDEEGDDDDDF